MIHNKSINKKLDINLKKNSHMSFYIIHKTSLSVFIALIAVLSASCNQDVKQTGSENATTAIASPEKSIVTPVIITEKSKNDTDDPAIWINKKDPSKSLIFGTDKDSIGALMVYSLDGKIDRERSIYNVARPNNVDVEYGFKLDGKEIDIVVFTERYTNSIRIFRVPEMQPVDNGGIPVFEGEEMRSPMGIGMFKNPVDDKIYAIVGRKEGPVDGTYLWQYLLKDSGAGYIEAEKIRSFGSYSGIKEVEAIVVDDALRYVYYADEQKGVRKYYADPERGNEELALFATEGFMRDHEGISIYCQEDGTGYIIVSDQEANKFHIFSREGTSENSHDHQLLKVIDASTLSSDGNEVTSVYLNETFPNGLFVAMSDDKTFQLYDWRDIAGDDLILKVRK